MRTLFTKHTQVKYLKSKYTIYKATVKAINFYIKYCRSRPKVVVEIKQSFSSLLTKFLQLNRKNLDKELRKLKYFFKVSKNKTFYREMLNFVLSTTVLFIAKTTTKNSCESR